MGNRGAANCRIYKPSADHNLLSLRTRGLGSEGVPSGVAGPRSRAITILDLTLDSSEDRMPECEWKIWVERACIEVVAGVD